MPFRVTVDPLSSAAKHSKGAGNVGVLQCVKEYWPVIRPDGDDGPVRMPLILTGLNASSAVYPGEGEWSIDGDFVRIFDTAEGGDPLTTGKVARFPKTVYAEGLKKGTAVLTLTLVPGHGVVKDNLATESLVVKEPRPLLLLEPKVIAVKGASAKLTLSADMPFDKGVLTVLSGGDSIQLVQADREVATNEFTSTTELEVKPVKGSSLEGVEFRWELVGVDEKLSEKLTVVQGTLEIHDKRDAAIPSKERVIHKAKSRARVVVSCQPKEWAGQLELESANSKVKLFTNSSGPDGENAKRQVAASDTPKTFYVQGLETSGAVWDTGLKLHLVGLANQVDEAKITVIETFLEVSKPHAPTAAVVRDARVQDFGTGASGVSVPPVEGSGAVTLYAQYTQFRSPRALVRVRMTPKDAPCKLIVRPAQEADKTTLFPEANERHRQGESACVSSGTNLAILAGDIALAENARAAAGNAGRYGAEGVVLWAEGTKGTVTPTVVQLDVADVDDDCGKVKFTVTFPTLNVEVRRADTNPFRGAVLVEVTDVATADLGSSAITFSKLIPKPTHPNPARHTFHVPIGNYRVKVTPQDAREKKFRVTLTTPSELPVAAIGPPVDVKFVLQPPYRKIQFIGYRVKTGAYKGLDGPAGLTGQQKTNAQAQAKAFAFSSVLDAVDASGDPGAPQLKIDLKGKNFDQVTADNLLNGRVTTVTGIDLAQAYAKELDGVTRNIARREGAKTDIEKRCAVMVEAIKGAFGTTAFRSDARVLKIFMAPEFYFRGQQGAYAVESLHQIPAKLSAETGNPKYNDWLFVLGSALGYREKPDDPHQEVTATAVPNTAKTKVYVQCHDSLPASLADTGWNFLVGATPYAIEDKQDPAPVNGWHKFTFTVAGVPSYPSDSTTLGVWNAGKVGITTATKRAVGRFTFNKAHAGLTITPGWVLKRGKARLKIIHATQVNASAWDLTVKLKPKASVTDGAGDVTEGRLSRDHSGSFTVTRYFVNVTHPVGNMADKCILSKQNCTNDGYSIFRFRVAGANAGTYDVETAAPSAAGSRRFRFAPTAAPIWKEGSSTLSASPDRCEVFSRLDYKDVHLTIDFTGGIFPSKGWKFEQGTVKGLVLEVKNPAANRRDVVLRLPVDHALNPAIAIKFMTTGAVEIFNVCFVQKGGAGAPASGDGGALRQRIVEKEAISSVDFPGLEYGTSTMSEFYDPLHHLVRFYDSQQRVTPRQGALQSVSPPADAALENQPGANQTFQSKWGDERDAVVHTRTVSEKSASGLGGASLFDMDGLSFGLEVCLDHGEKRLKRSASEVRVQLVPACGKTIDDDAIHILPDGFIFNVDGDQVISAAQKEDKTAIPFDDYNFPSAVPEYLQLFDAAGFITIHHPEDLV
jgi:hypothetical protein